MKLKKLIFGTLLVLMSVCFVSCLGDDDEEEFDFMPIQFYLYAQDAQGNDLLDPYGENTDILANTTIEYNGRTYEFPQEIKDLISRAYAAQFYGLQLGQDNEGQWYMFFGEFDGATQYSGETFNVNWGNGEQTMISFSNAVKYTEGAEPTVDRHYYVDGMEVGSSIIKKILE